MNKLTDERIEEIIEEYGSTKETIETIEDILSVHNFTEKQFDNLIVEIASEYEVNKTNQENGSLREYDSLYEIIVKVLRYSLNDTLGKEDSYSESLNEIIDDMEKNIKRR